MNELHPKRLTLERFLYGDLPGDACQEIEAHLGGCERCSSLMQRMNADQGDFLAKHPFQEFAANNIPVAPEQSNRQWLKILLRPTLAPVFAVVLLMLVSTPVLVFYYQSNSPTQFAYKGGTDLSFLLRRNGVVTPGNSSDVFTAGDEIQVLYSARKDGFLTLLSIDTKGVLSFYAPETLSGFGSVPIHAGATQYYPAGIVLDSTKGAELIVGLFSQKPLMIDWIRSTTGNLIGEGENDVGKLDRSLRRSFHGFRVATLKLNKQ
jgi:hypothetical protein